jgi:hypothetical protein
MVPLPVPVFEILRVYEFRVKIALTDLFPSIVMVADVFVPVAAPDHPAKLEVASGVAVMVTVPPDGKRAVHEEPQFKPAGVEVTVPPPDPALDTVNAN